MGKPSKGSERRRSEEARDQIERNLKRVYDETLNEPLPDKLAELLERLKKQRKK